LDGKPTHCKASVYTGQHNTEKHQHVSCPEWDSNPQS